MKKLLLAALFAVLLNAGEEEQKAQIVKKVYEISANNAFNQIGEYYKKLLPYFTPSLSKLMSKYASSFFCINSSAAQGMVEFCPFTTLPKDVQKYSFSCNKGKCKIDDIELEGFGSFKNNVAKAHAEYVKSNNSHQNEVDNFVSKRTKYEKSKGNEKFIKDALFARKTKAELFSPELAKSYDKNELNEPLCYNFDKDLFWIEGSLLSCGPRIGTEYYAFECEGETCKIIDTAHTISGSISEYWKK